MHCASPTLVSAAALPSVFERRCLFVRLHELHELVVLASLGADDAHGRYPLASLAEISQVLQDAERLIAMAERLAARHVN
jgi:hypothetical protein